MQNFQDKKMMENTKKLFAGAILLAATTLCLSACSSIETEAKYPSGLDRDLTGGGDSIYGEKESVFGEGGWSLFSKKQREGAGESPLGVNSFLWRATLDTVSFMPLVSADPFGGTILTDWYTDSATPNERVKVNAFVLGRELKASGVRVRAFRQEKVKGEWRDAPVAEDTGRKLEDAILTRARQLRIAHISN